MKEIKPGRLCYVTALAILFLTLPPSLSLADEITLVADEWCPYNCVPDSDKPGLMVEMAQQVFGPRGHTIKYSVLPWARAKDESRAGKHSGIIGAIKGDAPDFIFPDTHLATLSNVFFVKKGNPWKFTTMNSLESVSLGVIRGYSYTDEIDAYIEQNKANQKRIQLASGDTPMDTLLRKLNAGRVDVVLDDSYVVLYNADLLKMRENLVDAGVAKSEPGYIAFSPALPKSKEYAKILGDGVKKLRDEGKLNAILARYGVTE